MTNYDRIKSMSVEEMAKLLINESDCERYCAFTKNGKCNAFAGFNECNKGIELWLNSEVEESRIKTLERNAKAFERLFLQLRRKERR